MILKEKNNNQLKGIWKRIRTLLGARTFVEQYKIPDWFANDFFNEKFFTEKFTKEQNLYIVRSLNFIWGRLSTKQSLSKETYMKHAQYLSVYEITNNDTLTYEEKRDILLVKKLCS